MKAIFTFFFLTGCTIAATAQTPQIPNGGFEDWGGNTIPPSNLTAQSKEPTGWYSNQSGNAVAQLAPQTCFEDASVKYSGAKSVRLETTTVQVGPNTIVVNGNVTTGIVNAPSVSKVDGYIGTINHGDPGDIRRVPFNGRPDSLVGWYRYTQGAGGTPPEKGKIKAILHVGNYYDPETPVNGNHPDSSMNQIGVAQYNTPEATVSTWTRFSVPFTYVSANTPQYIMINMTPSDNQNTSVAGSKLWIDDLAVVYGSSQGITQADADRQIRVNAFDKTIYVDFLNRMNGTSELEIYSAGGQKLSVHRLDNNKLNSVDMSAAATGIYIYYIKGKNFIKSGKLYVE